MTEDIHGLEETLDERDEQELDTIILTLDDNSELECGVIGIFEVDDKDYIALVTLADEQVLLYRYIEDEENEEQFTLEGIETDELFERVSEVFYELFVDDDEMEE